MSDSLPQRLAELLATQPTPDELVVGVLEPSARTVLRRAACARSFDVELFEQVLDPDRTLGFAALRAHPYVESVPWDATRLRVAPGFQEPLFASWWAGAPPGSDPPPQLVAVVARLSAACAARGDELEHRYHQLLVAPAAAGQALVAAFDAAEARFDLPACGEVLEILETGYARRRAGEHPRVEALRARLGAAALWAREFHATVRYLVRASTRGLLPALLAGPHWILQVHGLGGVGKTAYVRQLIARECLPARIPVARIDFDFVVGIGRVTDEPWRVLILLAEQFDKQLPGDDLRHAIGSFRSYGAVLRLDAHGEDGAPPTEPNPHELQFLRETFVEKFAHVLAEQRAVGSGPLAHAVVVFDTLEEVLHDEGASVLPLLDLLGKIHAIFPGLRVVLSGRFDLDVPAGSPEAESVGRLRRGAGFHERYGAATGHSRSVELRAFSPDEAAEYLGRTRGLWPSDAPARLAAGYAPWSDVVEEGFQGSPFHLSLLADALTASPELTPAEVAKHGVDVVFLVERILRRLDDPRLPWVLRYGVAPRRLTLDFLREVLLEFVAEAVAGRSHAFDPQAEGFAGGPDDFHPFRAVGGQADAESLWAALREYASRSSWVYADETFPDALRFHPLVYRPMRRLEGLQAVYQRIHQRAIAYWLSQAEADPAHANRTLREAIYHAQQGGVAEFAAWWGRLLEEHRHDPRTRRALCAGVLAAKGSPPRVVSRAAFELARLALQPEAGRQRDLDAAERHLRTLVNLTESDVPPVEVWTLRARLALAQGHREALAAAVAAGWQAEPEPAHALELHVVAGEGAGARGDAVTAVEQLQQAHRLALEHAPARRAEVAGHLATALREAGRPREGHDLLLATQEALGLSSTAFLGERVATLIELGLLDAALDLAESGRGFRPQRERRLAAARAHLACFQPERALTELPNSGPASLTGFQVDALRGRAWAQLTANLVAAGVFDRAWSTSGSMLQGVLDALVPQAEMCLRLGDLRQAEAVLGDIDHAVVRAGELSLTRSRIQCATRILWARWHRRRGQEPPRQLFQELAGISRAWPLELRARVAAAELALGPDPERARRTLLQALEPLDAASQRLLLLDPLQDCPTGRGGWDETSRAVLDLLPHPDELLAAPATRGRAVLAWRLAEVYRVFERSSLAHALLRKAFESASPALCRELWLAFDRLNQPETTPLDAWQAGTQPQLHATMVVEQAERLLQRGRLAEAGDLLAGIEDEFRAGSLAVTLRPRFAGVKAELAAADPEEAGRWRDVARRGSLALGQPAATDRPEEAGQAPSVTLRLARSAAGRWHLSELTPGGEEWVRRVFELPYDLGRSRELVHPALVKVLAHDATRLVHRLRDAVLPEGYLVSPDASRRPHLRLQLEPSIAHLPWELLPWAEVVEPGLPRLRSLTRTSQAGSGSAGGQAVVCATSEHEAEHLNRVSELYAQRVPTVLTVREFTRKSLGTALQNVSPGLLHLEAALQEVRGRPLLEAADGPLGAAELLKLGRPGTIVLEALPVASSWLAAEQLLLRNAFAAELTRSHGVPAVAAIGPFLEAARRACRDLLLAIVWEKETLGTLAARFQQLGTTSTADALSFRSTAVFCADPDRPLLPKGTP